MKRIIEIERGEKVPSNAKWLKDIAKVSYGDMPVCDCHYMMRCSCEPEENYTTYDVFEIPEPYIRSGAKPTKSPRNRS